MPTIARTRTQHPAESTSKPVCAGQRCQEGAVRHDRHRRIEIQETIPWNSCTAPFARQGCAKAREDCPRNAVHASRRSARVAGSVGHGSGLSIVSCRSRYQVGGGARECQQGRHDESGAEAAAAAVFLRHAQDAGEGSGGVCRRLSMRAQLDALQRNGKLAFDGSGKVDPLTGTRAGVVPCPQRRSTGTWS
jgi:hypothetical protein